MAMNLLKIIERLQSTNGDFKQLILTADDGPERPSSDARDKPNSKDIMELIGALESNASVRSVFLDHFFVANLTSEEICLLFRALGSLPKLEQFSALSRQAEGWSIPMKAVESFMRQARSLSSLRLTSVGLVGTAKQFEGFTQSIECHPSMKEFRLRGACIVDGKMPLDNFLRSLSTVPLLEKIELTAMDLHQDLNGEWPNSPSSALRFCYSDSLKSLELGGWVLDEDLVLKMAKALETNESLLSLVMVDSHVTNKGCIAISEMLKKNKTIERIDLSYNRINDRGCTALANMLPHNNTLKEIGLFGNFHVTSRGVFLDKIKNQNFVLEDLLLDSELDAEMNFYLNLNHAGRRHLLQNEDLSRAGWVDSLATLQDDKKASGDAQQDTLSNLFYFVKAKPHFVAADTTA